MTKISRNQNRKRRQPNAIMAPAQNERLLGHRESNLVFGADLILSSDTKNSEDGPKTSAGERDGFGKAMRQRQC